MPVTRTARGAWVTEGLRLLAAGGPDAVRIEPLARELGVTKGGFYWHFDGRAALLGEMLDEWERVSVDAVIERVEEGGGGERERLHRLFEVAAEGKRILQIDLAVRDWARRDAKVARRLRRVDNRRMDFMRSLMAGVYPEEEVEARCLLAMSFWIGNHFVAADHGDLTRTQVLDRAQALLEG